MTTVVRARPAVGRSIDTGAFTDLTDVPAAVSWGDDGLLQVTFDADLDAATRRRIRCRIIADNPAEESLMVTLAALAAQNPTTVADRLTRLEQAVIALVKLQIRDDL